MGSRRFLFVGLASLVVAGLDSRARAQGWTPTGTTAVVDVAAGCSFSDSPYFYYDQQGMPVSGDGRYVVFDSVATDLAPNDGNGVEDVFVRDMQTCTVSLVSATSGGAAGNLRSVAPSISADGRFVVFHSDATDLVAGDDNDKLDVFVRDLQTGATELASVGPGGLAGDKPSLNGELSADGRFVVFESRAESWGFATGSLWHVYVRDRVNDTLEIADIGVGGVGDTTALFSTISGDGRYVVFASMADNLVAGDSGLYSDIFVRDRQTATIRRVTLQSGVELDDHSFQPRASLDGRWVTFGTQAANLVAEDALHDPDQYLWDAQTGALELVSVGLDGHGAGGILWGSGGCGISADGRYVAFATPAPNVVAGDGNSTTDAFVRDVVAGTTVRSSVSSTGVESDDFVRFPALSADGRVVVFRSYATTLVPGTAGLWHVFAHDAQASTPTSYCTAKVNSHGCTSAMASAGSPSASAASPFALSASNVLGNKAGLLFYGTNGPLGAAFQGGYLCVRPPTRRTPVQNSAGTQPPNGDCSGAFSFDFNAWIQGGPDAALVPGCEVWTQYWSRDPGFAPPANTNLTDAIGFTIEP